MKVKKIAQKKAKSGIQGSYQNALTRADLDRPPKEYSYVEIESIGKSVYFKPIPADIVIRMRDPQINPFDQLNLMMDLIANCVVNPDNGSPLMSVEEWRKQDLETINEISGAILGMQIVTEEGEGEESVPTDEAQVDPKTLANETVG